MGEGGGGGPGHSWLGQVLGGGVLTPYSQYKLS
jgi:hypothetical protein